MTIIESPSPLPTPASTRPPIESVALVSVDDPASNGASAPRIDVVDISQRVDDGSTTLHNINFTVFPGEIVGIAGGSGAGKSTLLDAIAGLRPPAGCPSMETTAPTRLFEPDTYLRTTSSISIFRSETHCTTLRRSACPASTPQKSRRPTHV